MRARLRRVGLYATIVAILAIALFPFWWMIDESLKQPVEIFAGANLYPHHPTTSNYSQLFSVYHFGSYLENSILVVTVTVFVSLVLGTLAAYSLARFNLRLGLNQSALVVALLVRMIPAILLVIPLYLMLAKWGLLNTRIGLIVIYTGINTSFVIWMMQSFLAEIPRDIEEAAMVDGDTRLSALRRVVLPLAAPGLAATAIFSVIATYNDFLIALSLTSTPAAADRPRGGVDADWQDPDPGRADGRGRRHRRAPDRHLRAHRAAPFRPRADARRRQVTARRLTTAQALIAFLAAQRVSRDGTQVPLLAGMFGIFGHGNVAGIGQAVQEHGGLRFIRVSQRAGDGAPGRRIRPPAQPPADVRLHLLDRPRRDQHGHRRCRWRRSTGCRCCCCPATCSPRGGSTRRCSSWSSRARPTSR